MRLSGNNIRQWEIMRSMYFMTGMDIPAKGKDHVRQGESEEMFEYLICAICPVSGDYEPGEPECGFLFPAFMDGAKKTQLCGRISEGSGTSAYRASENAWRVVR